PFHCRSVHRPECGRRKRGAVVSRGRPSATGGRPGRFHPRPEGGGVAAGSLPGGRPRRRTPLPRTAPDAGVAHRPLGGGEEDSTMSQVRRNHAWYLAPGGLVVAALVVLVIGYARVRDEIQVAAQLPYLLTGG